MPALGDHNRLRLMSGLMVAVVIAVAAYGAFRDQTPAPGPTARTYPYKAAETTPPPAPTRQALPPARPLPASAQDTPPAPAHPVAPAARAGLNWGSVPDWLLLFVVAGGFWHIGRRLKAGPA